MVWSANNYQKAPKMVKNLPNNHFIYGFVLLIFLFLSVNNYAQTQRSYKILGISVEGNVTADPTTIIANSGLKVGNEIQVPGDQTINAIKRLWSLGIFKPNIEILIDKKIDTGVFLLIKVEEYPRLAEYQLEGNDELDKEEISEKISLVPAQTLKPSEIYRIKNKILDFYREEGFLNATVDPQEFSFFQSDTSEDEITVLWHNIQNPDDEYETYYDYDPDSRRDVVGKLRARVLLLFKIEEGEEVSVNKIFFNGNQAFEDDDLKSEFDETEESTWWKFWSSANFKKDLYEKDKELLVNFYRKNGYRDAEILSDTLIYNADKTEVDLGVTVYEGNQYRLRNVDWAGNSVYDNKTLNDRLGFRKGDIYNYEKFNQNLRANETQSDVSALYYDNGYLGFGLETKEIRVGEDSIDVDIKITENKRFKVGSVDITGNTKTKDKVVRRELYTIPGDYFSRSKIFRSIQQLANLQYFNVEKLYQTGVDYRPANDSTVNLVYNVEEKSSDYLNASVGYSGGFGFSGAIGVTLTNFSILEPFQMGGGQILNFNWQFGVGNYYRTFSFGFTEPWFMDTPTLVGFDVFDTRQRYVYDLRQTGINFKLGRRLQWPDNYFYIQGLLKYQYNDIIDGRSFYQEGKTQQYTLGLTISRTDIDNPIFPSTGSKISLSGEMSGGVFLPGDVDYYKLGLTTDWYRRIFNSNRLALYFGVDAGFMNELRSGTIIQPFEFFYMGGNGLIIATTPLRGYEDRSVGPRNQNGDIVGGRVKLKYTAEIRAALALEPIPIYVLAFAEAGNTFYNLRLADMFELRRSVGIGARILINPVGLIGFDLGYGFDRKIVDGQDPKWLFHFQFGKGF